MMNTNEVLAEIGAHLNGSNEARRLFHGRGGCFPDWPWLNIELYPPVLLYQVFTKSRPAGIDQWNTRIAELDRILMTGVPKLARAASCRLLQVRAGPRVDWFVLDGEPPERPLAHERGLGYSLSFFKSQNIGFFPDMRNGRELAAELARDRRVLNLFAYTCAFSVTALAAGANHVVNMDLSKAALTVGRQNHLLNGQDLSAVTFLSHDVLKSFGKMRKMGPFGLVIIDPPTSQARFSVERHYRTITRRLPEMLVPGADVIACLNAPHLAPAFLREQFADSFRLIQTRGRPPEFKEKNPDRGLKIQHYRWQ